MSFHHLKRSVTEFILRNKKVRHHGEFCPLCLAHDNSYRSSTLRLVSPLTRHSRRWKSQNLSSRKQLSSMRSATNSCIPQSAFLIPYNPSRPMKPHTSKPSMMPITNQEFLTFAAPRSTDLEPSCNSPLYKPPLSPSLKPFTT